MSHSSLTHVYLPPNRAHTLFVETAGKLQVEAFLGQLTATAGFIHIIEMIGKLNITADTDIDINEFQATADSTISTRHGLITAVLPTPALASIQRVNLAYYSHNYFPRITQKRSHSPGGKQIIPGYHSPTRQPDISTTEHLIEIPGYDHEPINLPHIAFQSQELVEINGQYY